MTEKDKKLAGGLGFEPRLAESESAVLPLDDPPIPRLADHMGGQDRPAHMRILKHRVLRTFARFVQTDLLALDLAGVAGEEAGAAQGAAERLVMLHQRAGNAVPDGAGLTTVAAAAHGDREIHGVHRVLVSSNGWRTMRSAVSRPKYSSMVRLLMVILPEPGLRNTRADAVLRRPVVRFCCAIRKSCLMNSDVEGLRLLRLVIVLRTGEDLELADHGTTEAVLRQHALHRDGDDALGRALHHFREAERAHVAHVASGMVIELVGGLFAAHPHFVGIHYDNIVAGIDMRGVFGLVLVVLVVCVFAGFVVLGFVVGVVFFL